MTVPEPVSEEEQDDYRRVMARLASGVSVIAVRQGSHDLAMTATSLVSVSIEPPTVLFCVHADARLAEAVGPGRRWAVSILAESGLADADWLATPGRPTLDQLGRVPHERGELSGAAVLSNASGWLECETDWVRQAATHDVVTGRVLTTGIAPDRTGALVHHLGRLQSVR